MRFQAASFVRSPPCGTRKKRPLPDHDQIIQFTTYSGATEMALSNQEILDAIAAKSVLEISELIKMMEEKFGVSAAAAAVAVAAPAGGGVAAAPVEEKTEFTVMLMEAGANK